MKSFKKVGAIVMAIAMLASSMSAFACANDTFMAYDISKLAMGGGLVASDYAKLYMCPETDRVELHYVDSKKGDKVVETAEKLEWKHAFYEADYPHRDIEVLCLDDVETTVTRFVGNYADVNVKEIPEFWEAKKPYYVFNRLYSDLSGEFAATQVIKSDWKTAPVATSWNGKGFDKFVVEDGKVVDYSLMYDKFASQVAVNTDVLDVLYSKYLAAIASVDAEGNIVYTDDFMAGKAKDAYAIFEEAIPNVSWKELTGPDYVDGGYMTFDSFAKIVDAYVETGADISANYDDLLVAENMETLQGVDNKVIADDLAVKYPDAFAKVEWKTVGYEMVAPYRYYQVLCINGIPMDGSAVEVKGAKDYKKVVVDAAKSYDYDAIEVAEYDVDVTETAESYFKYAITPATAEADDSYLRNIERTREVKDEIGVDYLGSVPHSDDYNEYEVRFVKYEEVPGMVRLPNIWRYTGGYAQPTVEWKVAFAEAKAPYEIFERKYVDGKETDVYRPSGKFANNVPTVIDLPGQARQLKVFLEDTTGSTDGWKLAQAPNNNVAYPFYVTDSFADDLYLIDLVLVDEDGTILSADLAQSQQQYEFYNDDAHIYYFNGRDYNGDATFIK